MRRSGVNVTNSLKREALGGRLQRSSTSVEGHIRCKQMPMDCWKIYYSLAQGQHKRWTGNNTADLVINLPLIELWYLISLLLVPNTQAHNYHPAFSESTTYQSLCSIKIFEINRLKRCENNSLHKSQCIFYLRKEKSCNFLESLKTHSCVDYTNRVICTCRINELCVISVER